METLTTSVAICSTCSESLNVKGECLACLLRGGLNGSVEESAAERGSLVFSDFEIARREDGSFWELGSGAMGVTYRATDKVLHRTVALKVIETPAAAGDSQAVRERFLREARAAAALKHPNVAGIFQFGASPEIDRCYYAMELVEGETLEALVRRDGPLKAEHALEIAIQVTRALVAAAAQGLIHRDLKPGNIMITRADVETGKLEVKVIDFGLAKVTNAVGEADLTHGGFVGTPSFASPEQFCGAPADARSDIYSLGVTLWYSLTGQVPYPGKTIEEIRDRQQRTDLPVEQLAERKVPAPLIKLLRRTLAIDPTQRPASARELMEALESCLRKVARRIGVFYKLTALIVVVAIAAAATLFLLRLNRQKITSASASNIAPSALTPLPEKSIAVLPFENLSADKDNAYFAGGVQDEILSDLAKIADLKVISRTSVLQYQSGAPRNLSEIGNALGVAHVLEGSVQRVANRVRVNAQLVDTRTDAHLWAETYDRDLADVFAIQSEIAQKIADQLQAKISRNEKAAIEQRPTNDLVAYDLYVQATSLIDKAAYESGKEQEKEYFRAIELLNQAIARDSAFLLAYCRLAEAHDELYFDKFDSTPSRLEFAKSAINSAFRLKPDSGEAHLALAAHLYHGYFDYDRARDELAIAVRTLPNNARIFEWSGYIDRRQSRWHDAVRDFERAMELDPRNVKILTSAATTYGLLREYKQGREVFDRVVALEPNNIGHRVVRAWIDVRERANTRAVRAVLEKILADNPEAAGFRFDLALYDRDAVTADHALAAMGEDAFEAGRGGVQFSRAYLQGSVARMKGDAAAAHAAFTVARAQQEEAVRAQPDYGPPLCVLGLIDAALGRKEEALREGRRALELAPMAKDSLDGVDVLYVYAVICAWTGERDLAIEQVETLAKIPAGPSYGEIRLGPNWDPLRGDPRFEKIVASLAPSVSALTSLPEKSIAVLPLENLSEEKENAFFAEGIQDELLSNLSKIKDLKVISRTSVMQYKSGTTRNLKDIAQQLGVGHVVEGSVRRSGNHIRVSVQLIDAQTDRHLWAQNYDRTLADSIALQDELATEIAAALGATLSPQEKAAVQAKPTNNPAAYDAYLRGRAFTAGSPFDKPTVDGAIHSYQEAVKLDPNFVLAWGYLSCAQSGNYWLGFDPSPARLAAAKDALDRALALDPNLPETHLALGYYRYYAQRDFTGALAEFQQAEQGLPNNVDVIRAIALIQRRLGHWDEAIVALRRAVELDPRNIDAPTALAITYRCLRRFPEALATADRVLALEPTNTSALWSKAGVFWATGDLKAVEPLLANPGTCPLMRGVQALFQRHYGAAVEILSKALADKPVEERKSLLFGLGLSQQRAGDVAAARATYRQATQDLQGELDKVARDSFQEAELHANLGRAYAGLSEAASAIAEGQKAMAMDPSSKDPLDGPEEEEAMAQIYALLGDVDHAIPILKRLLQIPSGAAITPTLLRIDPIWDQIRNDPRFQELVAEKTP